MTIIINTKICDCGYRRGNESVCCCDKQPEIEHIPVADNTADVIISNCVINLSPD